MQHLVRGVVLGGNESLEDAVEHLLELSDRAARELKREWRVERGMQRNREFLHFPRATLYPLLPS